MFENPFKKNNPDKPKPESHKPNSQEKSQSELRKALEDKFNSLEPLLKAGIKEYEAFDKEGLFEDKEGEEIGSGDKKREEMKKHLTSILDRAKRIKSRLDSKEPLPQFEEEISATYTHPDNRVETITINIEKSLEEYIDLYKQINLDLPPDFEANIQDIWNKNLDDIKESIETKGFDYILVIPPTINLPELSDKTKMENGYYNFIESKGNVQTIDNVPTSSNTDKPRILLVHKAQNLEDRPELKQTLNIKGKDVKPDEALTLEDYLIFQRKYFKDTQKHLDEVGWTWLSSKVGARLVDAFWDPAAQKLRVNADDPGIRYETLGVRTARRFF